MELERRCLATAELRARSDGKSLRLVGYAAVFNSLSQPLEGGRFREKIRPGAFARSIRSHDDVRALLNHDPNQVLGRTSAGTLELSEDHHGLRSVIHLPDTTLGRDLYTSVSRGDINQMSFGFVANSDAWSQDRAIRELIDVTLFDVSPVTYPAYQATSIAARDLGWYQGESVTAVDPTEDTETERERLSQMLRLARLIK
jgi:uncharacterized protein